jgi:glycosyltransferase involved in cell wall biosynthesis
MDGLEWKRSKYNKPTQYFLTHAEKWGVRYSDHLIADSKGIQAYLKDKYNATSDFVSYGAGIYEPMTGDEGRLKEFNAAPFEYDLVIARFEPENNIETILKAYKPLKNRKLLLVGNHMRTVFGKRMHEQYGHQPHISFLGSIFDTEILNALRYYSRLYLHGHSVGGTNPSLLEAMGCSALICAHDNIFNRHILVDDAFYFSNEDDIQRIVAKDIHKQNYTHWLQNNLRKIDETYNWEKITEQLENKLEEWHKC